MSGRMLMAVGGMVLAVSGGVTGSLWAGEQNPVVLVQIPYEAPPKQQDVPDVSVPPNTSPLTPEEMTRLSDAATPPVTGGGDGKTSGEDGGAPPKSPKSAVSTSSTKGQTTAGKVPRSKSAITKARARGTWLAELRKGKKAAKKQQKAA